MRSGSTFTGDVFNQNPDAFYVYEPLHITDGSFLKGNKPDLAMFWSWPKREPPSRLEMQDDILTAYFNCTFNHVYVGAITDWVMRMANRTNLFFNCLRPDAGFSAVLRCLPLLQQSCSGAKAVVVKTIRYTMERALTLMENDPKVKVIHLVRDPRATLYSRHWLGLVPTRAVSNVSATFCRQVAAELRLGDVISERFPGRLLRVRYEDLARQPLLQASRLLRFAGLQLSPQQAQHLDSVTLAASKLSHSNRIGVKKTNSSFTASAWRDDSSFSFASSVDAQCREAYQLAGYLPLDSEAKLRDHEVSSMLGMEQVARLRGQ